MKVVAWSNMTSPLQVNAGDTANITFVIGPEHEAVTVVQVVALGYDDVIADAENLPAKIFTKMQEDYANYKKVVAERDHLLEIVAEQAAALQGDRRKRWLTRRQPRGQAAASPAAAP